MKKITYEDWQKNPTSRMMWVWNVDEMYVVKRKVVYVLRKNLARVLAITDDNSDYELYNHCAEIEKEKQRRMTNKELSWWLSEKPHRELRIDNYIYHDYDYKENEQDAEVTDFLLIRENDGEWKEPLVEVEE